MEYIRDYDKLWHTSPPRWLGNPEYLETKSHSSMVFSFTTAEDREKFIGFGPIWVFKQWCTITSYKDQPHIFTCHNCSSFAHKMCETLECLKCGSKDHSTNTHPINSHLHCINCRKEHASNYINCNCRRCLLGLNPILDSSDPLKKSGRNSGKKTVAKLKSTILKDKTTINQVVGLDGNQLLKAINKDSDDTPMKLHISSAMHENAQEQLNQSSQCLWEKANPKQVSQSVPQTTHMEGILGDHSQSST